METADIGTTLYDRVGGEKGVDKLLIAFYGKVLADPLLKPFFKNTPMDKLIVMQRELFGAALDGPHAYSGRELHEVHAKRGITDRHFHLFRQHLLVTLQEAGASADDIRDVVRRVSAMKKDITV
jgi:hemoglobin